MKTTTPTYTQFNLDSSDSEINMFLPPTPPFLEMYNVKNLKTAPFILYYVNIVGNRVKYLLS